MARSGRAKGANNVPTNAANVLVEQQSTDRSHKPETGLALSKSVVGTDDKSFANIHTGDRAVHQSVQMTSPSGSVPTQAEVATALRAALSTASTPAYDPASPHGGETTGSKSTPDHADMTLAEARQPSGAGSVLPRTGMHANEPGPNNVTANASGSRSIPAHDAAQTHPAGGGGGGSASHGHDGHVTNVMALHPPSLAVSAAVGAENTTIPLAITTGLVGTSPTTMLSVAIAGLPEGAMLSAGVHNPDGTWTLTGDQLAGLTLTPAPDSGEDFTLTVTATAHDSITGVEANATTQLPVTVIDTVEVIAPPEIPVVTAPSLAVSAAVGAENGTVPLVIDAGLVDLGGSETLTVTIAGLPEDATLSAGVHNPDGTWTLTGDQLAGLTLTPAANSGEDFTLTVTATAHDSITGVEANATTQLPVTVIDTVEVIAPPEIPVVTAPSLAVSAAVGAENGTIPLVINAGLADFTGNETLTVVIAGLPEDATLSAGIQNPDGTWTLTGDQLTGLTVTPAPYSGEDFTLTITATARDSVTGIEAHATTQLPVTVIDAVEVIAPPAIPSVTAPSLTVSAAVGAENGTIPLVIDAGLVDVGNNETLTVIIAGLPESATLSAGVQNSDGTWTLSGDQLTDLTVTPAQSSSEDFTLTITATAHDSVTGVEAHATTQLPVTVIDAVEIAAPPAIPSVSAPSLAVSAVVGAENGTIPLTIDAGLVNLDGSETLIVTIAGLPEGATLSTGVHNPDGTWTLTGDQLTGLTLTPTPDSGEDFTLAITATAHDSITGIEAHATTQLSVTVIDMVEVVAPPAIPSVIAPSLAVSAAVGAENGAIPLVIDAGLVDLGGNETLTVTVAGLPEDATLSAGIQNPDGTWTLTGDQLAGLTLTPAPDSGEDFTLAVTATAHDSVTGIEAHATTQLPVTVIDAVEIAAPEPIASVTAPTLAVSAAVGAENGTIPLAIDAGLVDLTGNETLTATIAGLPEGAMLSVGVHNPDGTWTLTGDQLAGLTLTPAPDSSEDFTLTVTATAHDSITGVKANATTQLPVTVIDAVTVAAPEPIPSVTAPNLAVSAAVGAENGSIPLVIDAGLTDLTGNETLTVTIAGLPEGATLSAGVENPDGTWTLTGDQLAGLTLTPSPDSGEDFTLAVTATTHDSITGVEAHATTQLPVTVIDAVTVPEPSPIPAVTAPSLAVSAAVGAENGTIPLVIDAGLVDLSAGETLTVTIAGLPEGATLSAGIQNPDGTWTLIGDQLTGLTVTPAPDSGDDFTLTITATAHDSITGVEAHATTQIPVTVIDTVEVVALPAVPAVTAPSLAVSAAVVAENGSIPLVVDAGLVNLGGNETLTVVIAGLPEGATLSAGVQNPDGNWTLSGDQLADLTLTPAPDSGEDFALTVTATAHDNVTGIEAHATTQLPVTVIEAVEVVAPPTILSVTAPSLAVSAAVGAENGAIPLVIDAGLVDLTNNETLTVTVAGLPEDAALSAGIQNPDGTWTLTGDQLAGLTLTPAPDSGEDFTLTITATAHDSVTGVEAHATTQLPVTVIDTVEIAAPPAIPSVTAPSLAVSAAVGAENGAIPLVIDAALVDLTGNETLTVTVAGLPEDTTLSAGIQNSDGTWTLTGDQLAGLTVTPAPDSGEDFTLTISATAHDSVTGIEAHATTQLPVTVIDTVEIAAPPAIPSVSAPNLAVSAAVGAENGTIPLVINAGLADLTGNETLTMVMAGLPENATLSAGIQNPDGTWTLTGDQLAGLTVTPAPDSGEDFTLTITATAHNTVTGLDAHATTQLPVTVIDTVEVVAPPAIPAVTSPSLAVSAAVGAENTTIPLAIDAGLVDLTGNETLTATIAGLPEGATLSAGVQNSDGTWILNGGQLAGLTLTPAPDSGEDFTLTVTATAHDSVTGVEANAITQLPVTVIDAVEIAAPPAIPSVTAPSLVASAATGLEDQSISLNIWSMLDGTEISGEFLVAIGNLPLGAALSAGTAAPDGAWIVGADQLDDLTMTPPPNMSGSLTLSVTPITVGTDEVAVAGTAVPLVVDVHGVADAPMLSVSAASGLENAPIPLALAASLGDLDGSESLTITIAGLPEGATLSSGVQRPDGTWAFTGDQLAGLTLTPPADTSSNFTLSVTATAHEAETDSTASTTLAVPVTVIDVLDAPTLSVAAVSGLEDTAIPLAITTGLVGASPTTVLSVAIDGVPEGATLSAGTQNTDGSWTLTGDQLAGLTLAPAPDSSGDFTLNITATAHDSLTGSDATATASLPVEVIDVIDAPSLVPTADATTDMTDAEFLQAIEELSSPTADTNNGGSVLDPVVSASTPIPDLSADTTPTTWGTTDTTIVQDTTVAEEPPPPPPPDPTTTVSFTSPTHL